MDYKQLSRAMVHKYSTEVGLRVLRDISISDAEEIIKNIDSPDYLIKLDSAVEKSIVSRNLRHLRTLINRKIHTLIQ